jgi:hypothetical protein
MMASYMSYPGDKSRLSMLQLEILMHYHLRPNTMYPDPDKANIEHAKLIEWSMIWTSEDTSTPELQGVVVTNPTYELAPRGKEHLQRLLKMELPTARVVWTLPEEDA